MEYDSDGGPMRRTGKNSDGPPPLTGCRGLFLVL